MADLRIDLSQHSDKYAANSLGFSISKKTNFIFGRNGTGKTTIADEIDRQLGSDYAVHVFKDFSNVAINERLDAVALGAENAEIQKQIDTIDGEIAEIIKDTQTTEGDTENIFSRAEVAKEKLHKQRTKIEEFYQESARQIKHLNNPNISSPNYYQNHFKSEISKAKSLSEEEILIYKKIIKADKKPNIPYVELPTIDLESYLKFTNAILQDSVKYPASIPGLDNNPQKKQFAKWGFEIHEHKRGEVCAFCGNEISGDRWVVLGNYLNSEVKTLESRIESGVSNIKDALKKIETIKDIDENMYYERYTERVKQLNKNIKSIKAEYEAYLCGLENALLKKKNNLFIELESLILDTPKDFSEVQDEYRVLIEGNNSFSKNLEAERSKSRDFLRFHEIQVKLDKFAYRNEEAILQKLIEINEIEQGKLQARKEELEKKRLKRIELISKTRDEEKIANKINDLLRNMGCSSFELKLVKDEGENQRGQYQIKGHNGGLRPVMALSKGEMNIIAFLYFMISLDRIDSDSRPKIIVLDDPMTSNDDTMQYIMISEIQKYYQNLKDGNYFILFTHNIHFYLNVRPNTAKTYKDDGKDISIYEKFGIYHLLSDGKRTTIKSISKGKNDFGTSYERLWKELSFLYYATDATSDIMLNPCRKICETYMKFTRKQPETFYGENLGAKKLFNVNQHSADDDEAEPNGKTKDEIKDILFSLFEQNNAREHFNSYWSDSQ